MNYIWAFMILVGVIFSAFCGTLPELANGALESAKEAVTLCLTMAGVMSFWTGLMKIAEKSGIIGGLSRRLRPLLHFLFPRLPKDHPANEAIATNMIANVFGLGWAATPAGLKAMKELSELEEERRKNDEKRHEEMSEKMTLNKKRHRLMSNATSVPKGTASNEMCTFLIINISSLQLIPVNVIAYRQQYGSVNPTAIVGPAIAATAVSTLVAVVFCKVMDWNRKRKG